MSSAAPIPADAEQRERDLFMLHELVGAIEADYDKADFREYEHEAFPEMLAGLDGPDQKWRTLTDRQRLWAMATCARVGINPIPPRFRVAVPRGREVELPPVLRTLPKRPPNRR